jgi:hypothetical protein
VIHRRRKYGPFDYEWSKDFLGVELMYAGKKFGEYCSREEVFADLKEFQLPKTVVVVGSIVLGSLICGILEGLGEEARRKLIIEHLEAEGYERFAHGADPENHAA